jgi:DNA mismatch repair protein MutL
VKFRTGDEIFRLVQNAVRRALLAHTPVPGIDKSPYLGQVKWEDRSASHTLWTETPSGSAPGELTADDPAAVVSQTAFGRSQTHMPLLRLVGQIAASYLVAEGPDGLYLVDQHAAHERVLFEKMMVQHQKTGAISATLGITAQELLQPVTVKLPPASARILTEELVTLSSLGFRVEEFGKNTFLVRAVPTLLAGMEPSAALLVLVEDFEEDEAPLQQEREARLIARVCKRAAVKAGQVLSTDEQRALLADLENCASPRTCPHGRPTMIHLSVDLLERQFGRRGAR